MSKTLDVWPALPIVVKYGGFPVFDPPTSEDEDNIVVALRRSDRISSIHLTVTGSLLANFVTIEEPFSVLEELVLLSQDSVQQTPPCTFRWGPHLRRLHSTRIAFPALSQRLSASRGLVDLQLHEIPSIGYLSPEAFASALSEMTQLQSLSLHFVSPTSRPSYTGISPSPGERAMLPALTRLKFRGTSEYLNSFVTRIDAPRLGDIEVGFFNQLIFHISQLVRFISLMNIQKSHRRADILSSTHAISITFTQPNTHARFTLQISCEQLDWQLSSMAQICNQFSSSGFLFGVRDLRLDTTRQSRDQDDDDSEYWPGLIHSFSGAEILSLEGNLVANILGALPAAEWAYSSLPALKFLHMTDPRSDNLSLAAMHSFVAWRPVKVEYLKKFWKCLMCRKKFSREQDRSSHEPSHLPHSIHCPLLHCAWRGNRVYAFRRHWRKTDHLSYHQQYGHAPEGDQIETFKPHVILELIKNGGISLTGGEVMACGLVEMKGRELQKLGMWTNLWGRKR